MSEPVMFYSRFERFWHWCQAALVLFLMFSGFEVHGSYSFLGYEQAVRYHSAAALLLLALTVFAIFWHFTTGQWRQYLPTRAFILAYVEYYLIGIFRDAPHPTKKTVLSKLNPLQRLTYLGLKLLIIPVMALSGLLYMYYRHPETQGIGGLKIWDLEPVAVVHTAGAFLLVSFVIAHVYLTTTGRTPTAHLRAMITGYEQEDGE